VQQILTKFIMAISENLIPAKAADFQKLFFNKPAAGAYNFYPSKCSG
jgi:hypothetical protein